MSVLALNWTKYLINSYSCAVPLLASWPEIVHFVPSISPVIRTLISWFILIWKTECARACDHSVMHFTKSNETSTNYFNFVNK